jgi:hypothetical protein
MTTVEAAREAKGRHSTRLLAKPGVSGVGIERRDGDWVIVIHADPGARAATLLPQELDGVPVVVVWDGPFQARG